jgi:hypothetical protein
MVTLAAQQVMGLPAVVVARCLLAVHWLLDLN